MKVLIAAMIVFTAQSLWARADGATRNANSICSDRLQGFKDRGCKIEKSKKIEDKKKKGYVFTLTCKKTGETIRLSHFYNEKSKSKKSNHSCVVKVVDKKKQVKTRVVKTYKDGKTTERTDDNLVGNDDKPYVEVTIKTKGGMLNCTKPKGGKWDWCGLSDRKSRGGYTQVKWPGDEIAKKMRAGEIDVSDHYRKGPGKDKILPDEPSARTTAAKGAS